MSKYSEQKEKQDRIKWLLGYLESQAEIMERWLRWQDDAPADVDFDCIYQSLAELKQLTSEESSAASEWLARMEKVWQAEGRTPRSRDQ